MQLYVSRDLDIASDHQAQLGCATNWLPGAQIERLKACARSFILSEQCTCTTLSMASRKRTRSDDGTTLSEREKFIRGIDDECDHISESSDEDLNVSMSANDGLTNPAIVQSSIPSPQLTQTRPKPDDDDESTESDASIAEETPKPFASMIAFDVVCALPETDLHKTIPVVVGDTANELLSKVKTKFGSLLPKRDWQLVLRFDDGKDGGFLIDHDDHDTWRIFNRIATEERAVVGEFYVLESHHA